MKRETVFCQYSYQIGVRAFAETWGSALISSAN